MSGVLFLPYTEFAPGVFETAQELGEGYGWQLMPVEIDPLDVTAYHEAFAWLWQKSAVARQSILVIEHDIVSNAKAFDEMAECDLDICGAPYWFGNGTYDCALGFTRFSGRVIGNLPNIFDTISTYHKWDGLPVAKHYKRIDARLLQALQLGQYYTMHRHKTLVDHHHNAITRVDSHGLHLPDPRFEVIPN